MFYYKINTLFERHPKTKKILQDKFCCPEFESISRWLVTEKINGTNIRIHYSKEAKKVTFGGRTDNAQIPAKLYTYLSEKFTFEHIEECFMDAKEVMIFGEGFGNNIQCNPGAKFSMYGEDVKFNMFDIWVDGWWIKPFTSQVIAGLLRCPNVPYLHRENDEQFWTVEQIIDFVKSKPESERGNGVMEGIVAKSFPQMMFRDPPMVSSDPLLYADYHIPITFKLKVRDFE